MQTPSLTHPPECPIVLGDPGHPAPRRILAVQTQRIGDVVCFTPLLTALRRAFPAARLHALVQPPAEELLAAHPDLDELLVYDPGRARRRPGELLRFVREVRRQRFDWAISIHAARGVSAALRLAGIPRRTLTWRYGAGRPPASAWLHNQAVVQERQRGTRHEVEYNLDVLRAVGLSPISTPPGFPVPEDLRRQALATLSAAGVYRRERFAVLHPGHGGGRQEWPPDHFADLGDAIRRDWGWPVVLTGSAAESALCEQVRGRMQERACSLAGKLRLPELSAVLAEASLFVSVPTGPMHLAAAMDTPVVALVGPAELAADRVRFAPYSPAGKDRSVVLASPVRCACPRMRACRDAPCMAAIRPEAVFAAAERLRTADEARAA